jgi:hypothetical protein
MNIASRQRARSMSARASCYYTTSLLWCPPVSQPVCSGVKHSASKVKGVSKRDLTVLRFRKNQTIHLRHTPVPGTPARGGTPEQTQPLLDEGERRCLLGGPSLLEGDQRVPCSSADCVHLDDSKGADGDFVAFCKRHFDAGGHLLAVEHSTVGVVEQARDI